MARPGLDKHPKFRRLIYILGCPRSHVRGYLECLWETAYENGDPRIGDAIDVELAADWHGEPGVLCDALAKCGASRPGFIEQIDGIWHVHDLFDHAPDYVSGRRAKEFERQKPKVCDHCGCEFRSTEKHAKFCSPSCRTAAYRVRHSDEHVTHGNGAVRHSDEHVTRVDAGVTDVDGPPAPAPAPAPAPGEREKPLALPKSLDTEKFRFAWKEFLEHLRHKTGQAMSAQWIEVNLMECCRRGVDKAVRDIRFSIEKNAKTLLDGSVRYDGKDGNGDGKPKMSITERKAYEMKMATEARAKQAEAGNAT